MIFQHTLMEISQISPEYFRDIAHFVKNYLHFPTQSVLSRCSSIAYSPDYLQQWADEMQYCEDTRTIQNLSAVHAPAGLYEALLRSLILDLADQFPQAEFLGRFSLYNSNWGYSHYPFSLFQGALYWPDPHIARAQPEARRFWSAMIQAGISTISDLVYQMYAPLTCSQRAEAFAILKTLHPKEVPESEDPAAFTYTIFMFHGWKEYRDIWGFLESLTTRFHQAGIPFSLPAAFLEAMQERP